MIQLASTSKHTSLACTDHARAGSPAEQESLHSSVSEAASSSAVTHEIRAELRVRGDII
eukprot:SAG31_NODE_21330_length_552_cov_0.922737_1_plen_58_part_01